MRRIASWWLSGLAALGLILPADATPADVAANPYQAVTVRNAFGLGLIPAPLPEDRQPPKPVPRISLQGFTVLPRIKQVLMKVLDPPQPGVPLQEVALTLNEGERRGVIEVLAIDAKARTVKLSVSNVVTNLALQDFIYKTGSQSPTSVARTPVQPLKAPGMPSQPQLTTEEQMVLMEVERERNKSNADHPPLPPTPLTPRN